MAEVVAVAVTAAAAATVAVASALAVAFVAVEIVAGLYFAHTPYFQEYFSHFVRFSAFYFALCKHHMIPTVLRCVSYLTTERCTSCFTFCLGASFLILRVLYPVPRLWCQVMYAQLGARSGLVRACHDLPSRLELRCDGRLVEQPGETTHDYPFCSYGPYPLAGVYCQPLVLPFSCPCLALVLLWLFMRYFVSWKKRHKVY